MIFLNNKIGIRKTFIVIICALFLFQLNGCCKKKNIEQTKKSVKKSSGSSEYKPIEEDEISVPDAEAKLLKNTGLSYSIDRKPAPAPVIPINNFSLFEREYLEGIKELEKENFSRAMQIFEEILKTYPDGEEASIAELCIAEIYFRGQNNEAALKAYKKIVEKYPGTQAAQNAAEGIKYLESFSKHESKFIPPDIEDKKRRGRGR